MVKKLTDKYLSTLKPGAKPLEVRDTEVRGLTFRLQPSGVATFFLQYRDGTGKQGRVKIGRYGDNAVNREIGLPRARALAKEHLAKITLGDNPADERRQARKDLTLGTFLDEEYGPWAKANLKSHESVLLRLKAGFAPLTGKRLADLSPFDFEKHRLRRLKEKLPTRTKPASPATINRDQQTLRAALTRAVAWGHMDVNPLTGTKKAKEDKNRAIRAMTADEEQRIVGAFWARHTKRVLKGKEQAMKHRRTPPPVPVYLDYFEPMIAVSLGCGLRRGEALALDWADVDMKAKTITVKGEGAKSAQTRKIPLGARVHDVLTEWATQTPKTGKVFPEASVDSIRAKWRVLLADAGVKGLRWHDLRHTFGSRLALAGVALPIVQKLMGHASITTTARYLHSTDDDARKAIQSLG